MKVVKAQKMTVMMTLLTVRPDLAVIRMRRQEARLGLLATLVSHHHSGRVQGAGGAGWGGG